jgi:hypothetical protein
MAAADDDRLIGQTGIIAFLDSGEKCIAIDVNDRQSIQFRVGDRAFGFARRASIGMIDIKDPGAVTTQRGHVPNHP